MDAVAPKYENICRVCMNEEGEMVSVFNNKAEPNLKADINEIIMSCSSIKVEVNDGLPCLICMECLEELKIAYKFKHKCESTDRVLRLHFNKEESKKSVAPEILLKSDVEIGENTLLNIKEEILEDINEDIEDEDPATDDSMDTVEEVFKLLKSDSSDFLDSSAVNSSDDERSRSPIGNQDGDVSSSGTKKCSKERYLEAGVRSAKANIGYLRQITQKKQKIFELEIKQAEAELKLKETKLEHFRKLKAVRSNF